MREDRVSARLVSLASGSVYEDERTIPGSPIKNHTTSRTTSHMTYHAIQTIMKNKNIRKLQNPAGKSYTVSIPIDFVRELKWKEHQKVVFELEKKRKRLIIKDWKK